MSQDWDIDDILASLDELLQEGKDEKPSNKEKASSVPMAAKPLPPVVNKKPERKPQDVSNIKAKASAPSLKNTKNHIIKPTPKRVEKTKLKPPRPLDIDVPDANFRQEPSVEETNILPRVVLTQDMMVNQGDDIPDPFSGMLDAMEEELTDATNKKKTPANTSNYDGDIAIDLNATQVEQVVELVSIDVSYQFNKLLPAMIRQSLKTHLQMLQKEPSKQQNQTKNEKK